MKLKRILELAKSGTRFYGTPEECADLEALLQALDEGRVDIRDFYESMLKCGDDAAVEVSP